MLPNFIESLKKIVNYSLACYCLLVIIEKLANFCKRKDIKSENKPALKRFFRYKTGGQKSYHCSHRGGQCYGPENTLLSYKESATKANTDLVEIDLRATADNEIVLLHDDDLSRTTDGTGLASEKTLNEIKQLDAGYCYEKVAEDGSITYPFRGKNIKIPTMEEAILELKGKETKNNEPVLLFLDFKSSSIIQKALDLVDTFNMADQVILGSNCPKINRELMQKKRDSMPICVDMQTMRYFYFAYIFGLLKFVPLKHDVYGFVVKANKFVRLSKELVKEFNKRGKVFAVIGCEMNCKEVMKKMIRNRVDMLLSDEPKLLKETLNEDERERKH